MGSSRVKPLGLKKNENEAVWPESLQNQGLNQLFLLVLSGASLGQAPMMQSLKSSFNPLVLQTFGPNSLIFVCFCYPNE